MATRVPCHLSCYKPALPLPPLSFICSALPPLSIGAIPAYFPPSVYPSLCELVDLSEDDSRRNLTLSLPSLQSARTPLCEIEFRYCPPGLPAYSMPFNIQTFFMQFCMGCLPAISSEL